MEKIVQSLLKKLNTKGAITLEIKVLPKNSKNEITGITGNTIKIKIKAVPENNKANLELVKFLSKTFNVPKSNIEILKGHTSHLKTIVIKQRA